MTGVKDVDKAMGWVNKLVAFLSGFQPEITSLNVNLKTCESELELVVDIPDNVRRRLARIRIPAFGNFVIDYVQDGSFRRIPQLWTLGNGRWIAKASQLPPGKFLIRMHGSLPIEARLDLVRIQPALNRDRTDTEERYWLDSMLKSPQTLEAIYKSVNVDEVCVGVGISLQRSYAATIPREVSKKIEAVKRWVQVGKGIDRHEIFHEWRKYRGAQKATEVSVDEIIAAVYQLTKAEVFSKHVKADSPYSIGEIQRKDALSGPMPEDMDVEARTRLTLKTPVAQGNLTFSFKAFESELAEIFGNEGKTNRGTNKGDRPRRS